MLMFEYNSECFASFSVPELDVLAGVGLVWLLNMSELKVKGLGLGDLTGSGQVFDQRHKLMMVPSVVVQLCGYKQIS